MTLPSWRDSSLGTMARGALWLVTEVGEGSTFTKSQLREAFPDVSQIDRRLRDLRAYDWEIYTRREDPGLRQEEQRFVKKGLEVWVPGVTRERQKATLTSAQRTKILADDDHLCRSCGAAAGDLFEDGVASAQLDIARRKVQLSDGSTELHPVVECNRCRVGNKDSVVDLESVIAEVEGLAPLEREILGEWIKRDRREFGAVEKLWAVYRTLPKESRDRVRDAAVN